MGALSQLDNFSISSGGSTIGHARMGVLVREKDLQLHGSVAGSCDPRLMVVRSSFGRLRFGSGEV